MAHEADFQIWIERVTDGQGIGVEIEDGMVASQDLSFAHGDLERR